MTLAVEDVSEVKHPLDVAKEGRSSIACKFLTFGVNLYEGVYDVELNEISTSLDGKVQLTDMMAASEEKKIKDLKALVEDLTSSLKQAVSILEGDETKKAPAPGRLIRHAKSDPSDSFGDEALTSLEHERNKLWAEIQITRRKNC